jgi:hypothetical protein
MLCASGAAALLTLQNPFSAQPAKELSALAFIGLFKLALLLSFPLLLWKPKARTDFFRVFRERNSALKLAALFAFGLAGPALYNVGLAYAHPVTVSALLNLSPSCAALVAPEGLRPRARGPRDPRSGDARARRDADGQVVAKEDTMGVVAANFVVSAPLIVPGVAVNAFHRSDLLAGQHHTVPIALLIG